MHTFLLLDSTYARSIANPQSIAGDSFAELPRPPTQQSIDIQNPPKITNEENAGLSKTDKSSAGEGSEVRTKNHAVNFFAESGSVRNYFSSSSNGSTTPPRPSSVEHTSEDRWSPPVQNPPKNAIEQVPAITEERPAGQYREGSETKEAPDENSIFEESAPASNLPPTSACGSTTPQRLSSEGATPDTPFQNPSKYDNGERPTATEEPSADEGDLVSGTKNPVVNNRFFAESASARNSLPNSSNSSTTPQKSSAEDITSEHHSNTPVQDPSQNVNEERPATTEEPSVGEVKEDSGNEEVATKDLSYEESTPANSNFPPTSACGSTTSKKSGLEDLASVAPTEESSARETQLKKKSFVQIS